MEMQNKIYVVKTTSNREDQAIDFIESNVQKKGLAVFSLIHPHGMRGYIFIEAASEDDARQAVFGVPYSKGILPKPLRFEEIETMLEQSTAALNIQEKDIVEIISGPFKKEKARVKRIDEGKEEIIVELLEAAVPIPITVRMDSVKVIGREGEDE